MCVVTCIQVYCKYIDAQVMNWMMFHNSFNCVCVQFYTMLNDTSRNVRIWSIRAPNFFFLASPLWGGIDVDPIDLEIIYVAWHLNLPLVYEAQVSTFNFLGPWRSQAQVQSEMRLPQHFPTMWDSRTCIE